jgi:hypothetical protein
MRMRVLVASLTVAVCAMGIGRAADHPELAKFRIVAAFDPARNEIVLKCTAGCAWTDLSFACGKDDGCSSPIDQYGMTD